MSLKYFFISLISFGAGIFFFAWYHNWIIITIPARTSTLIVEKNSTEKKVVRLYHGDPNKARYETKELIITDSVTSNLTQIVSSWLLMLEEEELTRKKISLQTALLAPSGTEVFISFDRNPFEKQWSTQQKLWWLENLLKTIREQISSLKEIRFLVNHQAFSDPHIDFSRSWPLNGFFEKKTIEKPADVLSQNKRLTLMLDPAGDAKNTGRIIDDNFERGITLQYAQEIKKELEKQSNTIVLITRAPGEVVEPLQQATFANRLGVDLYVHLACYHETDALPHLYFYYFLYNPVTDFWKKRSHDLALIPYNQAHLTSLAQSAYLNQKLYNSCIAQNNNHRVIHEPVGMPFRPLVGIQQPAIGIELGINTNNSHALISLLSTELINLIQSAS